MSFTSCEKNHSKTKTEKIIDIINPTANNAIITPVMGSTKASKARLAIGNINTCLNSLCKK